MEDEPRYVFVCATCGAEIKGRPCHPKPIDVDQDVTRQLGQPKMNVRSWKGTPVIGDELVIMREVFNPERN